MQTKSEKALLEINDLSVRYGSTTAVDSFNLSMKNETVVLFGPSGCGKTSILKSILDIHEPSKKVSGLIQLENIQIDRLNGDIGMTFQGPVLPNWLKIGDLCRIGSNIRKYNSEEQLIRITNMLKTFQIIQHIDKYPSELSGGERQRVALAVTLINEPKILLLDEPTTFIDGATRMAIWRHIEDNIRPLNVPTIIVSHDPVESIMLADRIIVLGTNAKIIKEIVIPFPHPRISEDLYKTNKFWELKKEIDII
jgi:ABC-type nitrate/sulfonate/bicarbonate transport system ATPase subunit